jgi:membrane protease YdiL (CAAX protease family)
MTEQENIVYLEQPAAAVSKSDGATFPSIWFSVAMIALFFLLQLVFSVVAVAVAIASHPSSVDSSSAVKLAGDLSVVAMPTILALVASNIAILIALWYFLKKDDRAAIVGFNRWSKLNWWMTLLVGVGIVAAGLGFNAIYVNYIVPDLEMQADMRALFAAIPDTAFNSFILFLAVAVLAPITEEFLFRGLLQNSFSKYMPAYAAILLSSAIFAAVHMQIEAFPALMVLGAGFGLIYHLTGSLRVNIFLHVINNSAALLLSPPA